MFSKYYLKLMRFRILLIPYCTGAVIVWDKKENKVAKPHNFLYWNWLMHTSGGFWFCGLLSVYLISRMGEDPDDEGKVEDPKAFATNIIGWAEFALALCTTLLAVVITKNRDTVVYVMNELIKFNETLMELLTSNNRKLDKEHKMLLRAGETLMLIVVILSTVMPLSLGTIFTHPIEPVGCLMKDWFDTNIKFNKEGLPFILTMGFLLFAATNSAIIFMLIVQMYYFTTLVCFKDMTPETVYQGVIARKRCRLMTTSFGVLEDVEIVRLYRIQHLLNNIMNEMLASVLISFHHVACLIAVVAMAFFAIKFQDTVIETGAVGYVVVAGTIGSSLLLIYVESVMFGQIVDATDSFRETGRSLVLRTSLFRGFLNGCQTFYVQEAYPFYTIHKETFLSFCEQALDNIINLLMG